MQRTTHVPPIKHGQSNGGMWVFRVILVRKKRHLNNIPFQGQIQKLLVSFFIRLKIRLI